MNFLAPRVSRFALVPPAWVGVCGLALSTQLFACGGAPDVVAKDVSVAEAEGKSNEALCQSAADRENPLIVEWPGTHKVDLESISKRGIVVVKLTGCKLEVLPRCEAKGAYKFEPVTPQRDALEIKDDADLFSKLPVASSALKGELASGKMLKLDYVLVGQRLAATEPEDFEGACAGGTHYVRTISVGAYNMEMQSMAKSGADIDVGIVAAGSHNSSSRNRSRNSGDVGACASKTDIDEKNIRGYGCGAPVRLGLAPLSSAQ